MSVAFKATVAYARWLAAGMPTRAADEQARILTDVCKPCEFYKSGVCESCGCVLRKKIKLATESCPLDPPKWSATA